MINSLSLLFVAWLLFVPTNYHLLGNDSSNEGEGTIFARFKLQVFEDDKPMEFFIVGHLSVYQDSRAFKASWHDVWISPMHSHKQVMLKPEHNSVDGGDIKNLIVAEDHVSFDIVLEPGRVMQITGTKLANSADYRIEGVGLWWIDLLKKSVKTEWRPVIKPIVLPYTEVF
jgi:hypothetical protein